MAQIQGVLYAKTEDQVVTEKFTKKTVVVKTIEEYPQLIAVEFQNNKKDLPNSFNIGEVVKVDFNIQGREVVEGLNKSYFVTLRGWSINKI